MAETDITEGDQKSDKPWLFKKGVSGNPAGRPPGARGITVKFHEALKKNDVDIVAHIMSRMLEDDGVLKAMLPYLMERIGIDPAEAPPHNLTYVEQHYIAGSGVEADGAIGTARMRIADINDRAKRFMEMNYSTPLREADNDTTDEPENTNA